MTRDNCGSWRPGNLGALGATLKRSNPYGHLVFDQERGEEEKPKKSKYLSDFFILPDRTIKDQQELDQIKAFEKMNKKNKRRREVIGNPPCK